MAKEYRVTLHEIGDGETVEIELFNIHPLLYLEIKDLIEEHVGDPNLWVNKVG